MLKTLLGILGAVALLAAADVAREPAYDHQQATVRYQDVYYLPPNDWLVVGSLGHREALASLVWIRALVNFGEEMGQAGPVQYFFNYADAILALDPDFKRVYRWAGLLALYRPVPATLQDAEQAVTYLERAHARYPNDGEFAWDLGATYAYEIPPLIKNDPKRKAEAKRKGAEYLRTASLLGAGPAWIGLNAASSMAKLGQTEQAMRHLMEIYSTVDDPTAKAEIEARLRDVQTENFVLAMRAADENLKRDHQADFPYLDTTLYLLVGRRPALDGQALLARMFDPAQVSVDLSSVDDVDLVEGGNDVGGPAGDSVAD